MNCSAVRRHLDAYLDSEVDPSSQIEFERHLSVCAGCQELLAFSRDVKAEVRRTCLTTRAPSALRARICAAMAEADARAKKGGAIRMLPLKKQVAFAGAAAAAALMALTWGIGTSGDPATAARASAMPMFEDVVRVHSSELPADVRADEPEQVSRYFRGKVQFPVRPAEFENRRARLLGARLSNVRDRRAAALYYNVGGRRLTVVVFDGPSPGTDEGALRTRLLGRELYYQQVHGYTVPVRRQDGLTYAFAGDLDRRQLLHLAATARVQY